jgi:hypothetical protein
LNQGLRKDWLQTPKAQPLGFGPACGRDTVMMLMVDGSVREVSITAAILPNTLRKSAAICANQPPRDSVRFSRSSREPQVIA